MYKKARISPNLPVHLDFFLLSQVINYYTSPINSVGVKGMKTGFVSNLASKP